MLFFKKYNFWFWYLADHCSNIWALFQRYPWEKFLCNHRCHHISFPKGASQILYWLLFINFSVKSKSPDYYDTFTNRRRIEFCWNVGKFFISSTSAHVATQDCPSGQDFSMKWAQRKVMVKVKNVFCESFTRVCCSCEAQQEDHNSSQKHSSITNDGTNTSLTLIRRFTCRLSLPLKGVVWEGHCRSCSNPSIYREFRPICWQTDWATFSSSFNHLKYKILNNAGANYIL